MVREVPLAESGISGGGDETVDRNWDEGSEKELEGVCRSDINESTTQPIKQK